MLYLNIWMTILSIHRFPSFYFICSTRQNLYFPFSAVRSISQKRLTSCMSRTPLSNILTLKTIKWPFQKCLRYLILYWYFTSILCMLLHYCNIGSNPKICNKHLLCVGYLVMHKTDKSFNHYQTMVNTFATHFVCPHS